METEKPIFPVGAEVLVYNCPTWREARVAHVLQHTDSRGNDLYVSYGVVYGSRSDIKTVIDSYVYGKTAPELRRLRDEIDSDMECIRYEYQSVCNMIAELED